MSRYDFEWVIQPSFFDDPGPLEDFSFWKPLSSSFRQVSTVKIMEGNLFKRSSWANFWESRYYVLFEDRLACFEVSSLYHISKIVIPIPQNGRERAETSFCLVQNMRVQVINSTENENDEKFGIRFIHNQQFIELYARSLELREEWMEKLKRFCTLINYDEQYTNLKLIGQGSFAKVYLAKRIADGMEFAVKTFDKRQLSSVDKAKTSLINEINILRKLDHENIIKLHEVHENETSIYLVLELLRGGELFERIVKKGVYTEKDASILMKKLLSALDSLHAKGIMHRDIKPENLVLKEPDNNNEVKIADFGLATMITQGDYLFRRCGTPGYVAPEILADEKYDQKVDIFSAGVVLYILLTGMSPFRGPRNEVLIRNKNCAINFNIRSLGRGVSEQALDLMVKMLAKDPKERISARECLEHPWIVFEGPSERGGLVQVATLSSAEENMKRFQETNRFNVANIRPKELERAIHCPSPVIHGRVTTIVESKKKAPLPKIDETDEIDTQTDENENGNRRVKRCQDNIKLLTSIYAGRVKLSLSTPMSKPDQRFIGKVTVKKAFEVQNTLIGMLRSNPDETKPGPIITSEYQEKKEKEVKKSVANVKMNLRKLF